MMAMLRRFISPLTRKVADTPLPSAATGLGVDQIQYRGGCYRGERPRDCRERSRYERRYNRRYNWDNGRYYHRDNDAGAAVAGAVLGFALGAAITGSRDDYDYYNRYRNDRGYRDYCRNRYRSFDPYSGTYDAGDGYRRYCRR
jgi:hypothetical protein